jgi:thiamine-monophosphate kinase
MAGEFDFIEWVRGQQTADTFVQVPAGDDLAVLRWRGEDLLLVGVDQVLDGVHFDSTAHSPRQIGRKAMNRNLSDCAAMACLPAAAIATVALPRSVGLACAQELYLGLREAADAFACPIVGGDTASWGGPLAVTVSILGRSGGVAPVQRRGARAGDTVYVSGPLGGAILGRHMSFQPRIELARELAGRGLARAMIDISDGLSRDLGHICRACGLGAIIEAARVPIHDDAHRLCQRSGRPALEHALHDGEDHELIVAGPGGLGPPLIAIGRLVEGQSLALVQADGTRVPLEPGGWEHRLG